MTHTTSHNPPTSQLPNGWRIETLGVVATVVLGQSPPGASYNTSGVGVPFFQGKKEFGVLHPTVGKWTTAGKKFAATGDILISVRAPVGPTNVAEVDCAIGRGLAAVQAGEDLDPSFLLWNLRAFESEIAVEGTGTTFDSISGEALRRQPIYVPPLVEQERIVEILDSQFSRLDAALATIQTVRVKAAQFRRSLLHAAFTGTLTGHNPPTGQLPNGWEWTPLKALVQFSPKVRPEFLEQNTELSFVPMKSVAQVSGLVDLGQTIPATDAKKRSLTYFEDGDVIFAKITPCMENGKTARPEGLVNGAAFGSTEFHVLRPTDLVNGDYLRLFLVHDDFRNEAERAMTGAVGQRRVPRKYLEAYELPCPPLVEQERIVEILDSQFSRLDAVLVLADAVEVRAAAFRRSLLHAAFSGKLTAQDPADEPASVLLERIGTTRPAPTTGKKSSL